MPREQTYIMIKPDGVQRGLVGNIIERFENKGFKLVALKMTSPSKEHLETHYADLKSKKFFPGLIEYMLMGPVVAMVWEGDNAVKTGRVMLGATNPSDSLPGTIRGDLCIDVGRNICHGSDSVVAAKAEIALWFPEGVNTYSHHSSAWVYEKAEEPVKEEAAATKAPETSGEYDEWTCYDDDESFGKAAPKLSTLVACQGDESALTYTTDKPTVILFWAKFLKWQVHAALNGCEKLWKSGKVNVIGIATDPKKSSVERHISKGECPTTFALCFDNTSGAGKIGGVVKNQFKALCGGQMKTPCVILVDTEGKIAWRQPFSSGRPYESSNFDAQVDALVNGKALASNGKAPVEDSSSDEDDGEEQVVLKDPMAADVAW